MSSLTNKSGRRRGRPKRCEKVVGIYLRKYNSKLWKETKERMCNDIASVSSALTSTNDSVVFWSHFFISKNQSTSTVLVRLQKNVFESFVAKPPSISRDHVHNSHWPMLKQSHHVVEHNKS